MSTLRRRGASRTVRRTATVDAGGGLILGLTSAAMAVPISIVTARALGPEGKGVATLVFVTTSQVLGSATLGVNLALLHYAGARRLPDGVLARQALLIGTALGLGATIVASALLAGVFRDDLEAVGFVWVLPALATLPLLMVARFLAGLLMAHGKLIEVGATGLLATLSTLAAAGTVLLTPLGTGPYLSMRAGALAVGALAVVVLAMRARLVPGQAARTGGVGRTLVGYGLRGHLGTMSQWVNYRFDVFVVAAFLPISRLGVYSVSVAAAEILHVVPNAFTSLLLQRGSILDRHESLRLLGVVNRLTSGVIIAGALALGFAAAPLVDLLFGAPFRPAVPAIRILLPGIWALALWKNIVSFLVGAGHPGVKSISALPSVALTVALDLVLIPRLGISGAAVASSCAYTASLVVALVAVRRLGATWSALLLPRRGDVGLLVRRVRSTASSGSLRQLWDDLRVGGDDVA